MSYPSPEVVRRRLIAAGVRGVDEFYSKLMSNVRTEVYRDLLAEAAAATTLRGIGLDVEMRDRPDLALALAGELAYAEVKHFRRKAQDDIDDSRLTAHGGQLVSYGDTTALEGKAAVEQVLAVFRKKLAALQAGAANLLVVQSSSSNCVEDYEVSDAMAMIEDTVAAGDEDFRLLNGVVFLSPSYSCGSQRSVYFYLARNPLVQLSSRLRSRLETLREWDSEMFTP